MTDTRTPDAAEARACVEAFFGHLQAGEHTQAEALTVPMTEEGFNFDPESFPDPAGVSIGEPAISSAMAIVPIEFEEQGQTQNMPAVCIDTEQGIRIDPMRSAALAMGADPKEIMASLGNTMEQMAEMMATMMGDMMGAMAEGMSAAFSGDTPDDEAAADGLPALSLSEDAQAIMPQGEDLVDDYSEQTRILEDKAIPAAEERLSALLGQRVRVDLDWAGCDGAQDAVLIGAAMPAVLADAVVHLLDDDEYRVALPGALERVMIDWDDDQEHVGASARNQTLSLTFGPFLREWPPSPILLAEIIKEPLGLD